MKVYTINYKTVEPVIYNKRTKHETQEDTFLYAECNTNDTEWIQGRIEELNAHKEKAHVMYEVAYFFMGEQEAMY